MFKKMSQDSKFFIWFALACTMVGVGILILCRSYNTPSNMAFFGMMSAWVLGAVCYAVGYLRYYPIWQVELLPQDSPEQE